MKSAARRGVGGEEEDEQTLLALREKD